jgi:hypothetical protein
MIKLSANTLHLILLALLLVLHTSSYAICADMKYVENFMDWSGHKGGRVYDLIIDGEIINGDYERLTKLIQSDTNSYLQSFWVKLNSNGGNLVEAIKIGELLKRTYKHAIVDGVCASSCFFVYIGAVERGPNIGKIGIHRPYFDKEEFAKLSPEQAEQKQKNMTTAVRKYLTDNDVPQNIIDQMFSMSSTEIHWLDQLENINMWKSPAWYAEYMKAKCDYDMEGSEFDDTKLACRKEFEKCETKKYLNTLNLSTSSKNTVKKK